MLNLWLIPVSVFYFMFTYLWSSIVTACQKATDEPFLCKGVELLDLWHFMFVQVQYVISELKFDHSDGKIMVIVFNTSCKSLWPDAVIRSRW